ncbi:MAG: hypothetical protein ACE5G9_08555 [Nitrospinales bacterium]
MTDFSSIKYGVSLSLIAILFGGLLGLSFGCCEDDIIGFLKGQSQPVLAEKYNGDAEAADKVVDKSWEYLLRAHFHAQTMGVISIVFSLVAVGLRFRPKYQLGISLLGGFGSLGYGVFWWGSGMLAPGMGSTDASKEALSLLAQLSAGSFFVAGVASLGLFAYTIYMKSAANEPLDAKSS